ncbi:serine hydrolase [bacterium]|nr:serine hydrolase [bacterium]
MIYLQSHDDGPSAKGFWRHLGYYDSAFGVDSVRIAGDSLFFFVPIWNCRYSGRLRTAGTIEGGFSCPEEPFDPVALEKCDDAARYLIEAKPGCSSLDFRYVYTVPAGAEPGLATAALGSAGDTLFVETLIGEIIQGGYGRINSFLLIKNGSLVCEEYFYGYSATVLHQIESVTKSVTSLLIGIAMDRGSIASIDEPLWRLLPQYEHLRTAPYREITLRHLLTMSAGFEQNDQNVFQAADRIEYALHRKLVDRPGSTFRYDGGCTEILGAVLREGTGMFADRFAQEYLFAPLGIEHVDWEILKQNGYPCMAGSLRMRPRDMARLGTLVLNGGTWRGARVVSQDWLYRSTAKQLHTHITGDEYGFQWWRITLGSGDQAVEAVWANGLGSQFIYIIPALRTVIVTTGHNYEYDSWAISAGIGRLCHLLRGQAPARTVTDDSGGRL